jgi:hypothetical protein
LRLINLQKQSQVHKAKLVFMAALAVAALFISPFKAQEQKDAAITQLRSTTTTSSGQPIILPKNNV